MLGHADIKQTQRYLNITDEELRKAMTGVWERTGSSARSVSRAGVPASELEAPPIVSHLSVGTQESGAPGRVRTCDLWLRRPTLYPAELRAHTSGRSKRNGGRCFDPVTTSFSDSELAELSNRSGS